MKDLLGVVILITLLFTACSKENKSLRHKAPIYFESVSVDKSNINFSNQLIDQDNLNIIEYLYYYNGGGVAIGDINNDGLEDIYFTANQTPDKLYLNLGGLKFKDISKEAGIAIDSTWSTGVTMEDVNNDGLLDIYVCKEGNYKSFHAHNLLYINKGNNTFEESSEAFRLNFSGFSTQGSFFDYDNDGDMDLYLLNHSIHTRNSYGDISRRQLVDTLAGDRLFENKLNEGKSIFEDVTDSSGILSSSLGYGLALMTSDINNDGLIDIYVGNDFHENDYLYINQGNKTFKESIADYMGHGSRSTMGVDIADINNDQHLDIFTLDMMPYDHEIFLKSGGEDSDMISQIKNNFGFETQYSRNALQLNQDDHAFSDIALMTNTYATDWSWSALINDYDNDGLNDIYITNGIYRRPNDLEYINYLTHIDFSKYDQLKQDKIEKLLIEKMPSIKISNIIFRNKDRLQFDRFTERSGLSPSFSNGAAYSDLDNDGDLDIVVNNINQKAELLENKSALDRKNNFISFTVRGNDSYKNPNGSKLYLYAGEKTYFKELTTTKGFQSASSRKIHFGLGQTEHIDSLKIVWLDGNVQIEKNLVVNQQNEIIRNQSKLSKINSKPHLIKYQPFEYVHRENNYLDYEKEPLIPEKLSTEGPALVAADFNGDGLKDLFIGGAKYQTPALYVQQKKGAYVLDNKSDFIKDIIYEDVDAVAFDLENDGDLDLYVLSGGNDKLENDPNLEDRIYINDGNAHFKRLKQNLIRTNGGSVSVGDFDGDGFDDLFIGSRSIPGGYGLSPYSFILKNNGKSGFNIVMKSRLGMVTDSKWEDINNDSLLDLILVGDWMPITIFINQDNSTFTNQTKEYGLENTQGMWNTIFITDLDNNGYKDIMGGNSGLNFKWKASKERPVKLYLDDFDNNGQLDQIIFYDFFGHYIPFASKDQLEFQLPTLAKKFSSYDKFVAIENIEALTGKKEKDVFEKKKITELRSMIYFNQGDQFKELALPIEAQMSSIEDFYVEQKGNNNDIMFVGNFLDYITALGQSDANSGGVVSIMKDGKWGSFKRFNLPENLNARRITKLDGSRFLILANNDKSYIIEVQKK